MAEVFRNAPIIEALIDFGALLPQDVSLTSLEGLHQSIQGEYPEKQKRTKWEGSLQFESEKQPLAVSRFA
jgi:hypothetical protein